MLSASRFVPLRPYLIGKYAEITAGETLRCSATIWPRRNLASASSGSAPAASSQQKPTAILLLNMGGPKDIASVHSFLYNLFSDADLIPLPFQSLLAPLITRRRTPKIQKQYAEIGGGSPILEWTQKQAFGMCNRLQEKRPMQTFKPYIAFRYVPPSTEDAVKAMIKDGVERCVVFSQYPQYSCSTTGSSLNQLKDVIMSHHVENKIQWSTIDRWMDHPGLFHAIATRVRQSLEKFPSSERDLVPILFSAHSLPLDTVARGETYQLDVAVTAHGVMQHLGIRNPWMVSWQSKVGPKQWLTPSTDAVLEFWAKKGMKNAVIVPVAFTTDHIETLYELDLEYIPMAKKLGMTGLVRAESLNDLPEFTQAMADVVDEHLHDVASGYGPGGKRGLRGQCFACDKERCRSTKAFFSDPQRIMSV